MPLGRGGDRRMAEEECETRSPAPTESGTDRLVSQGPVADSTIGGRREAGEQNEGVGT